METAICVELGIPSHLHTGDRVEDQVFSLDEKILRRFRYNVGESLNSNGKNLAPLTAFETNRMSCVRQKYCNDSIDALYNINKAEHYFNWGIIQLEVGIIESKSFNHPDIKDRVYSLKVAHKPEQCWYPHVEVLIFDETGQELGNKKPPVTVRTAIRSTYQQNSIVIKEAHPSSGL